MSYLLNPGRFALVGWIVFFGFVAISALSVSRDLAAFSDWPAYFVLAVLVLSIILASSLSELSLIWKGAIFLSLGGLTYWWISIFGGESGAQILHHVFIADYPQFIGIPLISVLIASMNLLKLKVDEHFKPGWFLLVTVPVVGNFATTWAMIPIAVSLYPVLKAQFGSWCWAVMITAFLFGGNILAMGTVLADPPQAYWAIQLANQGTPMPFFYPFSKFWIFLMFAFGVYALMLRYLGVQFGNPTLARLVPKPESWLKVLLAAILCGCIAFSLLYLKGYQITGVLLVVFFLGLAISLFMGKEVKHNTIHWSIETTAIFVAFFSVVTFMHMVFHIVEVPNSVIAGMVILLTAMADNAAAFAAGYPVFAGNEYLMLWYNLFPSVTFGSSTPLGNGPQIVAFLVIFVHMGVISAKRVFIEWFKVAWVIIPFIGTWVIGAMILDLNIWYHQFSIGLISIFIFWIADFIKALFEFYRTRSA